MCHVYTAPKSMGVRLELYNVLDMCYLTIYIEYIKFVSPMNTELAKLCTKKTQTQALHEQTIHWLDCLVSHYAQGTYCCWMLITCGGDCYSDQRFLECSQQRGDLF